VDENHVIYFKHKIKITNVFQRTAYIKNDFLTAQIGLDCQKSYLPATSEGKTN